MGSIYEKNIGQKSRATVPLNYAQTVFAKKLQVHPGAKLEDDYFTWGVPEYARMRHFLSLSSQDQLRGRREVG